MSYTEVSVFLEVETMRNPFQNKQASPNGIADNEDSLSEMATWRWSAGRIILNVSMWIRLLINLWIRKMDFTMWWLEILAIMRLLLMLR